MSFSIGWISVGALWLADAMWLKFAGFHVAATPLIAVIVAALAGTAVACRSKFPRISGASHALAMNAALAPAGGVFSYLCATAAFPLVDHYLSAADQAIGFDWTKWYTLVAGAPVIFASLGALYFLGWAVQSAALPFALPVFNPRRNTELVFTFAFSLAVTAILSMRFPAEGAIFHNLAIVGDIHRNLIDGLRDFTALRNGSLTVIDYKTMHGVIAFPSFHTTTAVLYAYALRGSGRLFRVVTCMNGMMLASIPVFGGHYLVDILAGLVVAAVTIFVSRALAGAIATTSTADSAATQEATSYSA